MIKYFSEYLSSTIDEFNYIFQPNDTPILPPEVPSNCSSTEKINALAVKELHDRIEEVAYQALVAGVKKLKIREDVLTKEQSGELLGMVKDAAHLELFKDNGYMNSRGKILLSSQVQTLFRHIGKIVHDRDTKLTNARYYTLSDLLLGLDDHNTLVKDILLSSWFIKQLSYDEEHTHLNEIKEKVKFYPQMKKLLNFDLESALKAQKVFWNTYFPGKRESKTNEDAQTFINVLEVRHYFGAPTLKEPDSIEFNTPDGTLFIDLKNLDDLIVPSTSPCAVVFTGIVEYNRIQSKRARILPLLDNRNMTVREFLKSYYPEIKL